MLNASMLLDPASSRGALVRAAIAAVVLLLVLAMMLRSGEDPIAEAPPQAVAEVMPPPLPIEPAPQSSAEVFPVVTPEPEAGPVPEAKPEAKPMAPPAPAPVAKPAPPPPPLVLQPRPAPVTVATDPVVRVIPPGSAALVEAAPSPVPERKPAASAVPAAQPAPAATGAGPNANHSLLLRDFGPLEAARTLRDAAETAGYPARVLHRVVLGPFPSRAEADAARKRNAKLSAIVIAGQGATEWWVQAGVFADGSNAEALRNSLAAGKDTVLVQARVTAGPYAGRPVAEQVLAALRSALGQPLAEAQVIPTR